jgi:hypothetical protein
MSCRLVYADICPTQEGDLLLTDSKYKDKPSRSKQQQQKLFLVRFKSTASYSFFPLKPYLMHPLSLLIS